MVELIWDGKCDDNGKRTAPVRIALLFQTVWLQATPLMNFDERDR